MAILSSLPQWILDCASSYNWDELVDYCHDFIQMEFCETYVEGILASTDPWGNNALHMACFHKPPIFAVRALLFMHLDNGEVVREERRRMVRSRSKDGSTPLLAACACGASAEVISVLLSVDACASIPSIMVCDAKQTTATMTDNAGSTPLEELCRNYKVVVESVKNENNVQKKNAKYLDEIMTLGEASVQKIGTSNNNELRCNDHEKEENLQPIDFKPFWRKVLLILHKIYTPPLINSFKITHACSSIDCPPELFRLAIRLYPLQLVEKDHNQLLPLHIIVSRKQDKASTVCRSINIKSILDACPQQAKIIFRGGRLPLNVALEKGWGWYDGINNLVNAAPDALRTRDIRTHFYPFMIAAVGKKIICHDDNVKNVGLNTCLDTIFNLLKCAPEILRSYKDI